MALSGPLFTEMNDGEAVLGGSIAFLVVFGGLWVGSVLAFALGKTLLHDYARRASKQSRFLRRLNRIIDKAGCLISVGMAADAFSWAEMGIKIVFMARSLPILPAEVFDYACAMTTLAVHEYAIGCIGSAVPVAFWTFSTAQASNLAGPDRSRASHVALILLNVGCLVLLTIVLVHVIQRHEQELHSSRASRGVTTFALRIDAKQEVAALLQAENLQILREGRDFTIRDKSNKLLQLWDDHGILPFLLRKEKKLELNKENFPLKVHVHKELPLQEKSGPVACPQEPPLVNDLIEPAFHAVKRTSSSVTTRASGSPEHLYARVDCEPPPFP
eukprot:g29577.t1